VLYSDTTFERRVLVTCFFFLTVKQADKATCTQTIAETLISNRRDGDVLCND